MCVLHVDTVKVSFTAILAHLDTLSTLHFSAVEHLLSLSHKYTHTHKNTFSPVTRHSDSCCSLRACLRVWYVQKQLFCCISTSLDLSCKLTFIQQKKTTGTENTEQRYRGSCRKKNNKILNATFLTKKENGQNDIENANHFNPVFNCKCSVIEVLRMK